MSIDLLLFCEIFSTSSIISAVFSVFRKMLIRRGSRFLIFLISCLFSWQILKLIEIFFVFYYFWVTSFLVYQSINQVYFQINMYKNELKVHISQIDRKKVEVEV